MVFVLLYSRLGSLMEIEEKDCRDIDLQSQSGEYYTTTDGVFYNDFYILQSKSRLDKIHIPFDPNIINNIIIHSRY
jgi:hypothetical protein